MGPERAFRTRVVVPFLKALPRTHIFSIQQVSISGTPDLLCCIGGIFVALELKSSKGKLSKLQEYMLEKVRAAEGVALVVHPGNWTDVAVQLTQLSKG